MNGALLIDQTTSFLPKKEIVYKLQTTLEQRSKLKTPKTLPEHAQQKLLSSSKTARLNLARPRKKPCSWQQRQPNSCFASAN